MNKKHSIEIMSQDAPVVELDSEAQAAYIRFSNQPVAQTKELTTLDCIATVDTDAKGHVVGVELIGVTEFGIGLLLERAGVSPISADLERRTRYVLAERHVAEDAISRP